jgi:hypothetical protein
MLITCPPWWCLWGGVPVVTESDENHGLVPPLKVLRKRLDGVYRADGFSGPTRRYVLIVALLVGLASLPTLAAITAGSNELEDGTTGAMDVPFLPPASTGPVVPVPVLPEPSKMPSAAGERQSRAPRSRGTSGATGRTRPPRPAGTGSSRVHGPSGSVRHGAAESGAERPAGTTRPTSGTAHHGGAGTGSRHSTGGGRRGGSGQHSGGSGQASGGPGQAGGAGKNGGAGDNGGSGSRGDQPGAPPRKPVAPHRPRRSHRPEELPARPFCHERGKCGTHESRHHRPDRSRHRHCDDSTHRARWTHHREGRTRHVLVHVRPTGRHSPRTVIREHSVDLRHAIDRHDTSHRRPALPARPHNVRPGQVLERTHNSRRHHAEHTEVPTQSRAYRGSHRAERMHRAEENWSSEPHAACHHNVEHTTTADWLAAADRSSRVGRHHADRSGW